MSNVVIYNKHAVDIHEYFLFGLIHAVAHLVLFDPTPKFFVLLDRKCQRMTTRQT